jgi:hypothetical protein
MRQSDSPLSKTGQQYKRDKKMAEIIPVGSNSGITRKDPVDGVEKIIVVLISAGVLIDFLQLIVQKGNDLLVLSHHGGDGGHLTPFLLASDEYLTGITGRYGIYIDSMVLQTNKRTSQRFGGSGGDKEYSIQAKRGEQIIGLWCRSDIYIDAIGAITTLAPQYLNGAIKIT